MQKEILTKENIKQDLKEILHSSLFTAIIFSVIILPLVLFMLFLSYKIKDSLGIIGLIIPVALLTMLLIIIFTAIFDTLKTFIMIYKGNYHIVSDKLIGVGEKSGVRPNNVFYKPYRLFFSSYGEFPLPPKNYEWSESFCMTDQSVYNYSNIGDEYYLIITDKSKILSVYNKMLFELKN